MIGLLTGGSTARTVATLLVGITIGGTLTHPVHRAINDRATVAPQRATLKAIEAAQAETTRLQEQADEAAKQAARRIQSNARAAAGARSELDRLRDTIASSEPAGADSCPATAHRAATLATVFGECATALEDMARKADGHANDALRLWETWPVFE
jgi:chitodextrinase